MDYQPLDERLNLYYHVGFKTTVQKVTRRLL